MRKIAYALAGFGLTMVAQADVLTWQTAPENAVWNSTSLNWMNAAGAAVAWWAEGDATFAESSAKTIDVADAVAVSNVTFAADGYTLGGAGKLILPRTDGSAPVWVWDVANGATARVETTIEAPRTGTNSDGTFVKGGAGVLQLAGTTTVLRLHARAGTVDLTGGRLTTAKLRSSYENSTAILRLDRTRIVASPSGNGILMGEAPNAFGQAYIGAGGLYVDSLNEAELAQNLSTAPEVETDGGLVKEGLNILRLTGHNTFNGGVVVQTSQLRVNNDDALGTGNVVLRRGTSFFAYGRAVRLANKVVQGPDSYAGSTGGANENLILTSVGTTSDNLGGVFTVGRNNNAYSQVVLSLTGADSEPLGSLALLGNLDLTIDGGVLTSQPNSSTFFTTEGFSTTNTPVAKVGPGGFVFDSNGATTELGVPLDLTTRVTNRAEVAGAFTNPNFEDGLGMSGWSATVGMNGESNSVQGNSSGFTPEGYPAYRTTNGTHYVVMRRKSTISTKFSVKEDGDYRVAFEMGCRPGAYKGFNMTVTVTIDGTHQYVIGPRAESHPFTRFMTDAYPLTAGEHSLVLATDDGSTLSFDSLLFDAFCLERIVSVTSPSVEKRGEGQLGISALATDGAVSVTTGTLALRQAQSTGAAFTVAAGAKLAFVGGCVSNATVTVPAGGALAFADQLLGPNLVQNGSFETDVIKDTATGWKAYANDWTVSYTGDHRTPSGVQMNGCAMSEESGLRTTAGLQTAFLRYDTTLSQKIAVPESGTYRLSFLRAPRRYGKSTQLTLSVKMDDGEILSGQPLKEYVFVSSEVELELEKGEHTLSFTAQGADGSGTLLLLDDIRLARVYTGMPTAPGTVFNLASGATVDVQTTTGTLLLDTVLVDGTSVRGTAAALRAAGVTVTGGGKVQIGAPLGGMILIR